MASAVRDQPDGHLPVQLLPGPVIPQRRERLPHSGQQYPPRGKSQKTSKRGRRFLIPASRPSWAPAAPSRSGPAGFTSRDLRPYLAPQLGKPQRT
jgi:hypothetical protein